MAIIPGIWFNNVYTMPSSTEPRPFFSIFEFWWIALAAFVLLIAVDGRTILGRMNLVDASDVVHTQVSQTVGSSLGLLDAFAITPTVITFVVWGVAGLVLFSIIQGMIRAGNAVKFEHDLGSDRYVHPAGFRSGVYWRRLVVSALLSFVLIVLLITAASLYAFTVVPVCAEYTQQFILQPSLLGVLNALLGVVAAIAGAVVVYGLLKLVLWHHRATAL